MGTIFSFCLPHLLFSVSDLLLLSFLFALVGLCMPNMTSPWLLRADFYLEVIKICRKVAKIVLRVHVYPFDQTL